MRFAIFSVAIVAVVSAQYNGYYNKTTYSN